MTTQSIDGAAMASKRELVRGSAIALVIAAVILTIAILPAEYGIDPTGIGKALGLTTLHKDQRGEPQMMGNAIAKSLAASAYVTNVPKQTPYRSDTQQVTLQPDQGIEIKTDVEKGATLIYYWKTKKGEKIDHEFHGEPIGAKDDQYESYIKETDVNESKGSMIASFTGTHGWYWHNKTTKPVTISLQASGFYTQIFKK